MGEGRDGREKRPQLVPSYSSEDLKFTVGLHVLTTWQPLAPQTKLPTCKSYNYRLSVK